MQVIPIKAQAGLIGFESAAAEYTEMELSLDELLIEKPSATWIEVRPRFVINRPKNSLTI